MKDKKLYITIAVLDVIAAALIIWNMQLIGDTRIRSAWRLAVLTLGLFVALDEKLLQREKKNDMYLFVMSAAVNGCFILRLLGHRQVEAMTSFLAELSMDSMVTGSEILFLVSFLIPAVIAVTCGVMAGLRAYKLNEELKAEEDNTNT